MHVCGEVCRRIDAGVEMRVRALCQGKEAFDVKKNASHPSAVFGSLHLGHELELFDMKYSKLRV